MATIEEAVQAQKALTQLREWHALGRTNTGYGGKPHILRCDVVVNGLMYCGQAYPGANNYHDAPAWLKPVVQAELDAHTRDAVRRAVEKEEKRLLAIIASAKTDLDAMLNPPQESWADDARG